MTSSCYNGVHLIKHMFVYLVYFLQAYLFWIIWMETVKKNLRSVLLSKVGGVPLKNVERDYKSLVGERLNWRQFGFQSFEAFLNEIPDVVKLVALCL